MNLQDLLTSPNLGTLLMQRYFTHHASHLEQKLEGVHTFDDLWPLMNSLYARATEVPFDPSWHNGTGYFDNAVWDTSIKGLSRSIDETDRLMLIIPGFPPDRRHGEGSNPTNLVVFERAADTPNGRLCYNSAQYSGGTLFPYMSANADVPDKNIIRLLFTLSRWLDAAQ